jgi:hypothetical protein
MTDANNMVHVTESELQQLVSKDTGSICKSKEGVICKDGPQPHSPAMEDCLLAETAQTAMSMNNLDLLSYDDISEDGKEGEDCGESRRSVDDEEWYVVDFEAICKVSDTSPPLVCVRNDDDFVTAVNKFRGKLVDVAFDSSWLWKEEVADHGNVVRHFQGRWRREARRE